MSRFNSIFSWKCPRCRKGNLFKHPISFHLGKTLEMNESCPHCGLNLNPEPGYYYGAMFVSYALTIFEIALVVAGVYVLNHEAATWVYLIFVIAVSLVLMPFNYRWGRAGWISLFHKYD